MCSSLAVTGLGMVTPVGYNTAQTCAALRAGITQFNSSEDWGDAIVVSKIQGFGSIRQSHERTKRIGITTCREAMDSLSRQNIYRRSINFSVLINEKERPGALFNLNDNLVQEIILGAGFPSSTIIRFYPDGHAAGMKALEDAQRRMAYDPLTIEFIWGIDSLLDIQTLAYLDKMKRLKGFSCPRGIIPGEASVCLVLQSKETVLSQELNTYCQIAGVGTSKEEMTVHSEGPYLGEGLTKAIYAGLGQSGWHKDEVTQVYCDMNGEIYRAHEWILALCRTLVDPKIIHPADCIGDIGAASAPLLIGMASIAFSRGYANTDKILIFCSSEFGTRGSVCLAVE